MPAENSHIDNAKWPENGEGVEVVPAYEVVAQRLRRAIHLGELPPGSKLPAERILSQRLGVSRITLREAIRVLEGEGYVEVGRGSRGGTTVRSGEMRPADVRAWMRKRRPELDALFQFRRINEAGAAERAATRVRNADVAELRKLVELTAESNDVSAFRSADVRFHIRIAELAESVLLRNAVEEARAALYVPFRAFPLEEMHNLSVPEHAAIVDALEQRDPAAAAAAMEAHLLTTEEQVGKLRESRGSASPT